jgi:endoribonuclease Dicer
VNWVSGALIRYHYLTSIMFSCFSLGHLYKIILLQVAQSFLTALQNDERANYQLDVKFQESYLNKVVSLLQCQLSEGAVSDKDTKVADSESDVAQDGTGADEIEEGELPDSHGESGC